MLEISSLCFCDLYFAEGVSLFPKSDLKLFVLLKHRLSQHIIDTSISLTFLQEMIEQMIGNLDLFRFFW